MKTDNPDNPEHISFEDKCKEAASNVAKCLHNRYGLTVNKGMEEDIFTVIYISFDADDV